MEIAKASNKKFIVAIVSLATAAILLVGALVGVLAATKQAFNAGFTINYDISNEVHAKVKLSYSLGHDPSTSARTGVNLIRGYSTEYNQYYSVDENGYTVFNPSDVAGPGIDAGTGENQTPPKYEIALSPINQEVTFYFEIVPLGVFGEGNVGGIGAEIIGNVSDAFDCAYYTQGGNVGDTMMTGDWIEGYKTNQNYHNWTFYFKMVVSVKDLSQAINPNGEANAKFNLKLYTT